MAKSEIEKDFEAKFGKPMSHKPMTDEDLKFLEAEFEKTFNYDPEEDEVDAKYSEEFNKWCDEECGK